MQIVVLRLSEAAAKKLAEQAGGKRLVGIYDVPEEFCSCTDREDTFSHWAHDPVTGWPLCRQCHQVHPTFVKNYSARVKYAFGVDRQHNILPPTETD